MKILMVCLGNICRSPLAEGILRKKLGSENIAAEVASAGTSDYHVGEPADERTVAVASRYGVDISSHRARQFEITDFDRYDEIYAMDRSNYNKVMNMARDDEDRKKVGMITNRLYPGSDMDVPDPYFGGDEGFDYVFKMLDEACEAIVGKMKVKH